ncbi:hypothetical protein SAMN04488550_0589 [Gordonia malaquae]|uniref:Uncharacterized protein n=1 Tax=Gordonia malaquae NBRC 108250 TaxID=1223542 RepID=M3VGE7_GORML|nr:hypothetical protein [Gordonia malaquae]GAC80849.1 hypothetical protein GM1_023_00080 [Gordonia malaquae NBRC 108250]SEB67021.1 hypothetical protein SAMN04488550_0589 [Gordonia malaquae]
MTTAPTAKDEQTARDCVAEAADLDAEATLLEQQADERYEDGPRLYGGGTLMHMRSLDVADGYRRRAAALRHRARKWRATAHFLRTGVRLDEKDWK